MLNLQCLEGITPIIDMQPCVSVHMFQPLRLGIVVLNKLLNTYVHWATSSLVVFIHWGHDIFSSS